jgi:hypothetical protein
VVLVAHNAVEAHLIGPGVLLVVLIVEHMGLLRVKMGVGEAETPRLIRFQVSVSDVAIGLLRKPIDLDVILGAGKLLGHDCLLSVVWPSIPHLIRLLIMARGSKQLHEETPKRAPTRPV